MNIVLFWILIVILAIVFFVSLCGSTMNTRKNRLLDLLVAVVSFVMIMLLCRYWR